MSKRWLLLIIAGTFSLSVCRPTLCQAQFQTERGAVVGGLVGALAGAGIGDHNDKAGAGALIGGAVGALSGAAIGNTYDRERAARAYAYERQAYANDQYYAAQVAGAVSIQDVISMTQSGVGDDVIMNHIRQNGVQRRLEVPDVIALHRQGVSEVVISTMQQAPLAGARPVAAPVYRRPVVVEERYYVPPPVVHHYHYDPYCYPPRHHHYHHGRSSFHWGFSAHD